MTNKEKASELAIKLEGEIGTSPHSRQAIEDTLMEMAEWKDKEHRKPIVKMLKITMRQYWKRGS